MQTLTNIIRQLSNDVKTRQASLPEDSRKTMLLAKYGDRETFLRTYNPDTQITVCADRERCFMGDYPTLAELRRAYGDSVPAVWLIPQLLDLSEFCGCRNKLSGKPLEQCADVIAAEFYFLKVSELMLFFQRFKSGRYGVFYGSVDPLVITTSLRAFLAERNVEIGHYEEAERDRQEREHRKNAISYEEYLRRKASKG